MSGMSNLYWIRKSGACSETELPGAVQSFLQPEDKAVAFYVDRFQAANAGFVLKLLESVEELLELRIFRADAELWAHRSASGAEFSWRIADDGALWENATERDFEDVKVRHTMETTQFLDISPDYVPYQTGERDALGCRMLRSSVGGHYALPLDDTDISAPVDLRKKYGYVRLVNYVSYDRNGIAGIADFRIAGFEPLSKGEDSA